MPRVNLPTDQLDWLASSLNSGDPTIAMTAAIACAQVEQNPPADALFRMFDPYYNQLGEVNNHIELKLSDPRQALPTGTLSLMGNGIDPLGAVAITCDTTTVPVVYDKGNYRWSGRVDVAHDRLKDGKYTVDCELVHDRTWLDRILCWPNPFLPILIQEPSEWFGIGPACTVMSTMVAEQCFRLQTGLWELVNNLGSLNFNYQAWFGTLLMQDSLSLTDLVQAVTTPIYVVMPNPLEDTSAWIEINGRMDTCWKLLQQQLEDNGIFCQVQVWLPGEPQPPGIFGVLPVGLQVPTIVVQFLDRSGLTGVSGGWLDGLEIDVVQLEGSTLGEVLNPLLNPTDEYAPPGVEIAPVLGVNFTIPWVILNADTPKGGIIEFDVAHHHPLAWQILVGGQSPQWLNDFFNSTLEYFVDLLMIVVGFTGIPDNVLDGLLDNVFLAFSLVEDFDVRKALGPYGFPEKFFPSGASALSVDGFFAEIGALWDARGYPAAQVTFIDGYPYELGRDIYPGAMASIIRNGVLYTDYVENITITDNRGQRNRIELQIGDGKHEQAAIVKVQRKIVDAEQMINILTMSTQGG